MSLAKYKSKRNFASSPEPIGTVQKNTPALSFVVQRHKASHLHYDLRLEMDGVLKSWAVPKGPSMNPKDKRLAMMVEDHPYSYKDFKGVIPSGYGAGIVEIWDKGKYTDIKQSAKALAEKTVKAGLQSGNIKFTLFGKKLKGEFALVKLKGSQENAWLLIKHNDAYAVSEDYNSENETSISSPINKWLAKNEKPKKKATFIKSPGKKFDRFIHPMLAKERDGPFDDKDWLFEIKWDGYRAISEIKNGIVKLYSRNGLSFETAYPYLFNELKKIKHNAVLDGEIVILNEEGKPDFQKLQHYAENTHYPLSYYVFDLLELNGKNICELPLLERKKLLRQLITKNEVIKYSDHIIGAGVSFFNEAGEQQLEGIIAKKTDGEYYKGKRTGEWLKIKHHQSTEVIIAGFTEPTGSRKYFGALVLGVKNNKGQLEYVGHTGSGFTDKLLEEVYQKLMRLKTGRSPFHEVVKTNMPVTWVKPEYVCEVKFTEWTNDRKMRHPIFLRMREDKSVKEMGMKTTINTPPSKTKNLKADQEKDKELVIDKIKVKTTNRNKIYWPGEGITKGMMIDYYQLMAPYILPYLKDRPESLKRNPGGINEKGFYHKDAGEAAPSWVKSIPLYSESAKKDIDYIICNNKATLAYLNNLGCIELNPWNSRIKWLDKPDYMIIDIDPSTKNTFEQVIETANVLKRILDKASAKSFCKTSGATGLHIFVPMEKKYLYEQVRDFAEIICHMAHEQLPEFTSMERNLKKRGNKIYLDYLQNSRGQTIAAAYSIRPHAGATVSTPLLWKEVKPGLHPSTFTIYTVPVRVKKMKDLFKEVLGKGIDLKTCIARLTTT